jgi:hypothetical protein
MTVAWMTGVLPNFWAPCEPGPGIEAGPCPFPKTAQKIKEESKFYYQLEIVMIEAAV